MKKLLSLLLILTLLLTACSAPAETAEAGTGEAETAGLSYRIFLDLVETQGANPSEGKGFSDPEDIAAYCEKIYGYIDPALAGDVFYGGPEEMTALMKQMYQAVIGVQKLKVARKSCLGNLKTLLLQVAQKLLLALYAVVFYQFANGLKPCKPLFQSKTSYAQLCIFMQF